MRRRRHHSVVLWITCVAGIAAADDQRALIDMNNQNLRWRSHRNPDTTCVLTGTAVSELRDDAFEVQFRHSRGQKPRLFVLIPGLQPGGTVFMESPTTPDRWRIYTDNYVPALVGEQVDALRRNVAAGIPLLFTFEYGKGKSLLYETVSLGAMTAASWFTSCVDENALESLKAVKQ